MEVLEFSVKKLPQFASIIPNINVNKLLYTVGTIIITIVI